MAMRKFPLTDTDSLGQFSMVSPDGEMQTEVVTGTLRLVDTEVTLEVSPEITPMMEYHKAPNGMIIGQPRASEPAGFTVIGSLAMTPRLVSLWGTDIVRTTRVDFAAPEELASGNQEMRVRWCLTGDALRDPGMLFDTAYLDITNLHDWTANSYFTRTISNSHNGMPQTWTLDFPERESIALRDGGELSLSAHARTSAPSIGGFDAQTNTKAKIVLQPGAPLETIMTEFATPLESLMTILSGKRSPIRGVQLRKGEETAVDAYGIGVDASAPQSSGELLLRKGDVEQNLLVNWLGEADLLSPVPQILASVWAGSIPTAETESLTLATTTEALHELLYPKEERFTAEEIQESKTAIDAAEMPPKIKQSLTGALNNYRYGKPYKQRVEVLAEPVAKAVPSCIGDLSKWRNAVVDARHRLAHGATGAIGEPEEFFRLVALTRSLRWMLTFRLLLHCGVSAEELGAAAARSDRYRKDRRKWEHFWTKIYATETE